MAGKTTISTSETRIEALDLQSSAYGVTMALVYGVNRVSGNMLWYGAFKANAHTSTQSSGGKGGGGVQQESTTYTYSACVMMGLAEGPIAAIPRVWKDKTVLADIPGGATALAQLGLSLAGGALGQSTWPYLNTFTPAGGVSGSQALGYSGLAYVYAQDYGLGSSASVLNHSFEVQGQLAYSTSAPDANPSAAASDVLTNVRYGAGFPAAQLETSLWSTYCLASNTLLSPALTEQMQASEFVEKICALTNTAPVWSGNKLEMIPYGDTVLTANGATYTPNVTPPFDLTDDDFIPSEGEDPIRVTRKPQAVAYNHIRVEFSNRANYYNVEIAEAKDSASIDAYGLRSADVLTAHWICDAAIAQAVAQRLLQRAVYIRNTYEFQLPWTRVMLSPMDLVTLTDEGLGFDKLAVRITAIEESDDGELSITAEDFPVGVAHAALYTSQLTAGYQHNYNAAPGSVLVPMFFEAPVERTTTGLEVYAAVRGADSFWGGCRVWTSLDGVQYKDSGMIYGGARYGKLTGPVSGGSVPVLLNGGQMLSGSATDSANLATLCYIGGANPEYLAHGTATLTGALAYTLSGLQRAAFTTSTAAHATNDPFARVDDALAKSGPLDLALIGKTIHFKFTSFNIYKSAEQSLADVSAYPYVVTGAMAQLPPAALSSVTAVCEGFGIRIACARSPEPDVVRYEYRQGSTWATAQVLEPSGGTSYLWQVQATGTYTFWVSAVDVFDNYGPAVSATTTTASGTIDSLARTLNGENLILQWASTAGSFSIAGYEVRFGTSWAAGTLIDFRQTSTYTEAIKWGGTRLYWVAVIDVKGNYGVPASLGITVNTPSVVTSARAEVIDNNVLLYWSPSALGPDQLPIDRYEVRKGASWAAGSVVGSNGNSTFASVFEQAAGTFVYWVSPVDTAGNFGVAVGITASVNQPPDYILRNDYNSPLTGAMAANVTRTVTNFYAESGVYIGPVNTAQTWSSHFSSGGWSTPSAQSISGLPLYAEPGLASGVYEEVIDYGAAIPATVITATLASVALDGLVSAVCTISYKLTVGAAWTVLPSGNSALLPSFRYVRVHYDFSCTAGANLLQITGLNVKLAIKQRSDSGAGVSVLGGAPVSFGYAFLEADTPIVQAAGLDAFSKPFSVAVIFVGVAYPTGFSVRIFNSAGTEVAGIPFSWTVRGY